MGYTIELSLAKEIIKSLNSKIQGKLFDTNFFRNLLHNRSECRKQALEEIFVSFIGLLANLSFAY